MIVNGKDKPIETAAALPNVGSAMAGLFQPMTFTVMQKSVQKGLLQEIPVSKKTRGVRQPFSAQQLAIKPEGERSWKWEMIHVLPDLLLETDDRIVFAGVRYRVMEKFDCSEYGYLHYNIVQDFK